MYIKSIHSMHSPIVRYRIIDDSFANLLASRPELAFDMSPKQCFDPNDECTVYTDASNLDEFLEIEYEYFASLRDQTEHILDETI